MHNAVRLLLTCVAVLASLSGCVRAETTTEATPGRRVTIPPLIVEEPPLMIPFRVEESFEVPCVATGEPQPVYKWKMDDKDFDPSGNDGRIAIQPGVGTLIFARPLARDQGIYQCLAQNQVGTALTIKVDIRQAYLEPFQTAGTRVYNPQLGSSQMLRCIAPLSFPDPDIFWATMAPGGGLIPVDLDERVTMDPIGNLHIVNVLPEDYKNGDTYACIVQNKVMRSVQQGEYAKIIPQGDTDTYHPPSVVWSDPLHQVSLRGHTWKIKCIFSGNPTVKVDWTRIDGSFPEGRWRQESYGQQLVIENVQIEDMGNYECQGINDDTPVPTRKSFDLTVEAAPFWVTRPTSIDGAEGDVAVFTCETSGIPEPVNFWYINGQGIPTMEEDPNRIIEQKTLTFLNLTKDYAQVIQCNSTNKHGYVYANAYLNVLTEPPLILDPPLDGQKAAEDQTIQLQCNVFGSPKPLVIWRKGSEQLTGGRYRVLDNGNLEISDVMLVDAGVYVCTATNDLDTVSATGSLIVRRRTEIQSPPIDVMVHEGTEAKITCTATTDPEEVKNLAIDWMKDGQFIDYDLAQRVFRNDMDNSLTISGTMSLDTGKYTCVASNGIDSDQAAAQLVVQAPPDPPNKVTVQCGTSSSTDLGEKEAEVKWQPGRENYAPILNFIVQFNTSSNPDTWYDVANNISQNFRSIRLDLAPFANYTFRVLARNKIGISDPSQPSVTVCDLTDKVEPPYKNPDNVIGEGDEPDNLVIFWTPMSALEHNGPQFKYIVSWILADRPEEDEPESITITDLELWYHEVARTPTYQPYRIQVKAANAEGDCPQAPPLVIGYSGEGEPLAAPSNVNILEETLTDTEVDMAWDQVDLSPESIQGFFRGYRVQFAKSAEWPDNIREVDFIFNKSYQFPRPRDRREIDVVMVTLTHLPPNADIRATVRVLNKYYAGPPSQEIEFSTTPGEPGPPAMFDVSARGPTHFDLVWQAPYEPNGDLIGYQIYYQTVIGLNLGRMQYRDPLEDPLQTTLRLTGLSPDMYYRVYLSAMTAQGVGEPIFLDMKTTLAEPPAPPTFAVVGLNETWINVTWEKSQSDNPGSVFYVQYRMRGQYLWVQSPDEYVNLFMELINLESGTTYQVRVVAKNGDYQEAPSEWLEIITQGNPTYSFTLGTSVWFYGIWIALFLLIILLTLFFVAKKYTDENFVRKEGQIEDNVRDMQAEEFGKQMELLNEMAGGSQEYLDASMVSAEYDDTYDDGEPEDYANDYPPAKPGPPATPVNTQPLPPYNGYSNAETLPKYDQYTSYAPAPVAKEMIPPEPKKPPPPTPREAAFQAVQQQNRGYSYDEPLPVHSGYRTPSRAPSQDNISIRSSNVGDTSFVLHKGKAGPKTDTFV